VAPVPRRVRPRPGGGLARGHLRGEPRAAEPRVAAVPRLARLPRGGPPGDLRRLGGRAAPRAADRAVTRRARSLACCVGRRRPDSRGGAMAIAKKLGAEVIGTYLLVLGGCGSAVFAAKAL